MTRGIGYYTVEVDGLTGSFVVLNMLKPDEVELSELEALGRQALIHDDEGRPIVEGEYVIFSVLVINIGETRARSLKNPEAKRTAQHQNLQNISHPSDHPK